MTQLAWLGQRAERTVDALVARGIPQDALDSALRCAYWNAQRAIVPVTVSRQCSAAQRRLERLEDAITAVLDQDEVVPAELAGHLHVARTLARAAACALPGSLPRHRGRPGGWRQEAERALRDIGAHRAEARELLRAVAALVRGRPLAVDEARYLRAAFRTAPAARRTLLLRFPIPPRFGRPKNARG